MESKISNHQFVAKSTGIIYILILLLQHITTQWLAFNSTQYAFVAGTGYSIATAIFGLLMGYLTDRLNRKWFLFVCALGWSLTSAAQALTSNFGEIIAPRLLFAIIMSSCTPLAVSLITDYYPHEKRGMMNSVYAFGIYFGAGLSSLTLIIDESLGWRNSIYVVSGISLFFGLFLLLLKEPSRIKGTTIIENSPLIRSKSSAVENSNSQRVNLSEEFQPGQWQEGLSVARKISLKKKIKHLFTCRTYVYLLIAMAFRFGGSYSFIFWNESFFKNKYPHDQKAFSIGIFIVYVFGALPSSFIGGMIGDKFEHKYPQIKGIAAGFGSAVAAFWLILIYYIQPSFWVSMVFLYLSYTTSEWFYGPSHALVNRIFPSDYQGMAIAIYNMVGTFTGAILVLLLGVINDSLHLKSDPTLMGYMLGIFVCTGYVGSMPFFLLVGKEYEKLLKTEKEVTLKLSESDL